MRLLLLALLFNLLDGKCAQFRDKHSFYKENKDALMRLVSKHEHQKGECQPEMERMRCNSIVVNGGNSINECRVTVHRHSEDGGYRGDLKVNDNTRRGKRSDRNCVLVFQYLDKKGEIKIASSGMKNYCARRAKYTKWGPWTRCLAHSCDSPFAMRVRRRYCSVLDQTCSNEIDIGAWVTQGRPYNPLLSSKMCHKCKQKQTVLSETSTTETFHNRRNVITTASTTTRRPVTTKPTMPPTSTSAAATCNVTEEEKTKITRMFSDLWRYWDPKYPKSHYECDEYIYTYHGRDLNTCECLQLIRYKGKQLRRVHKANRSSNELDKYPQTASDCADFIYTFNGKDLTEKECLVVMQQVKKYQTIV